MFDLEFNDELFISSRSGNERDDCFSDCNDCNDCYDCSGGAGDDCSQS